ncbi:MAG TPA: nucleoside triphosphate pyrophosphohydrolase [Oscillatoriaceae cyanobacterium M33_DOE_052]|uniref:Nucleotide pyrophosphohydrolase n=1 Tax=Planktothricoides sp. SpSt-374 TaxID=2282167 RepID=A0A7C3ZIU2_9CYAN|nr:nucleoside triphosphate pyrophosphohydrolase [Oscillatoriaceae cyanobacterium M33_DOE_052]
MRQEYNKLVRDNIPDIIRHQQVNFATKILSEEQYRQALRQKLLEEAAEAATANDENLVMELADLSEVIDALMAVYGISLETVQETQNQRRRERGGFTQRLMLLWTDSAL